MCSSDLIYLGTSSWKYEGWLGQIYTRERYFTRGRFSQKKFESECLAEYAETFPAVCGDFSFYQFPSESYWQRLFASAPSCLKFGFKVPEEITVREWPKHARYGGRAGLENENYMDARLLESAFLRPLERYGSRVGVMIFEFGTMGKRHYEGAAEFAADLRRFLRALPSGWRYAVEHPDEAAGILLTWAPDAGLDFQRAAVRAVGPLVDAPQVSIGWIEATRWQALMGDGFDPGNPGYTMQFAAPGR